MYSTHDVWKIHELCSVGNTMLTCLKLNPLLRSRPSAKVEHCCQNVYQITALFIFGKFCAVGGDSSLIQALQDETLEVFSGRLYVE